MLVPCDPPFVDILIPVIKKRTVNDDRVPKESLLPTDAIYCRPPSFIVVKAADDGSMRFQIWDGTPDV